MLRKRDVSPVELAELYLDRIERINPRLGAYITVSGEHALDAARAAEKALTSGEDVPDFCGVPISIKDLNDTAGIRTTHGTALWADRVPERDDELVARIRRAGFTILGKTVTPEFGPLNVSEPPAYPPGRNPWNLERSCGGSSGGAAAAIVAGLCPVSQGSDGGGSIRNPSSWCGTFGLKPSRASVSVPWSRAVLLDQRADRPHRRRHGRAARRDAGLREGRRALGDPAGSPRTATRPVPTREAAHRVPPASWLRGERDRAGEPPGRARHRDAAERDGPRARRGRATVVRRGVPRPVGDDLRRQLRGA